MSLDAMKQALEALEECTAYTSSESWSPSMTRECEAAITALRAAIKEAQGLAEKVPARGTLLEQTLGKVWDEMPTSDYQKEMEQEPETELETYKRLYELRGKALERPCINCGHQPAKIKTMAQPKQEPVGWFGYDEKISTWFETNEGEDDSVPLYAGARGWKGLTLEETVGIELSLRQYHDGDRYDLSLSDFARAIEAKLKEKNNG